MGTWDEIKKEVFTEKNMKKLGSLSRKVKTELSNIPIISIIGDASQGVSGLGEVNNLIKKDPNNPKYWLFYYEAFMTYRYVKGGFGVARGIINPFGLIVGKGISSGLNAVDDEYQKFEPKKCLLRVISIVTKSIKEKRVSSEELAIYAKSLYYLGVQKIGTAKEYWLNQSIKNISVAIKLETRKSIQGEFLFYLAQMYKAASRMELYYRTLNLSRKLGFLPAYHELASLLKKEMKNKPDTNTDDLIFHIDQIETKCPYTEFKYTYVLDFNKRVDITLEHVVSEQSKKFSETTKKIGSFFRKL